MKVADVIDKIQAKDNSSMDLTPGGNMQIQCIPFLETSLGVYCQFAKDFAVSWYGQFVFCFHISPHDKYKVLKYDFKNHKCTFFNYEHQQRGICLELSQKFNLVMTGGNDYKVVVFDSCSGIVKKIFDMGTSCLYNVMGLMTLGGKNSLTFITQWDLKEVFISSTFIQCKFPIIMSSVNDKLNTSVYVGGKYSYYLTKIVLSKNNNTMV